MANICEVCFGSLFEGSDPCSRCMERYKAEMAAGIRPPGLEGFTEEEFPFGDWYDIQRYMKAYELRCNVVRNSDKSERKKQKKYVRLRNEYFGLIGSIVASVQRSKAIGEKRTGWGIARLANVEVPRRETNLDPYAEYREHTAHR